MTNKKSNPTLCEFLSEATIELSNEKPLFKFLSIDVGLNAIANNTIAFSRPDRFNDPFDCSIELLSVNVGSLRQHMSDAFPRILKSNYVERFRLRRQLHKATDEQVLNLINQGLVAELSHRGVICFSKQFDNILMWAHYCNNHNGVCIGYDRRKLYDYLRKQINEMVFLPVSYPEQINPRDLYPVNNEAILYWLKTKSSHWQYEEEVRISGTGFSFNTNGIVILKIPEEIITSIYIGTNVKKDEIGTLIERIKKKDVRPRLYKMIPDHLSFCLKSEEIVID